MDQQSENEQPDAPHRSSRCVERDKLPGPDFSVQAGMLFFLFFVFVEQSCTGREDSGKCQKQAAHVWTVLVSDNARECSNQSTEQETNGKFMSASLLHRRRIDSN
jgi:hypothetical protein